MVLKVSSWAYRKLGRRYFAAYFGWEILSALTITLGTVGILTLYQDMSAWEFKRIVAVGWGCVLVAFALGYFKMRRSVEPLLDWVSGERGREGAEEAWRTAVALPREFITREFWQ